MVYPKEFVFQFLMVRLKESEGLTLDDVFEFQFLMVRLKA